MPRLGTQNVGVVVQLGDLTNVGAPKWADWNQEHMHTWYNRHRLVLRNDAATPVSIPFVMEGGNNAAFYITEGSPLFRDMSGEPNGLPIQISKNWHETPSGTICILLGKPPPVPMKWK